MSHTLPLRVSRSLRLCQRGASILLVFALIGCTTTGQGYKTKVVTETLSAPDADGKQHVTERSVDKSKVSNLTLAPPFGSKADATHDMHAEIDADGHWVITMGSAGKLEGGEIATMIQALTGLTAELSKLIATINPTTAPLEGLTP